MTIKENFLKDNGLLPLFNLLIKKGGVHAPVYPLCPVPARVHCRP